MSCIASLVERFDEIADPRMQRTRAHSLTDILALAVLAVIAGAEGWEDIEEFGKQKISWLKKFLDLPSGILLTIRSVASFKCFALMLSKMRSCNGSSSYIKNMILT